MEQEGIAGSSKHSKDPSSQCTTLKLGEFSLSYSTPAAYQLMVRKGRQEVSQGPARRACVQTMKRPRGNNNYYTKFVIGVVFSPRCRLRPLMYRVASSVCFSFHIEKVNFQHAERRLLVPPRLHPSWLSLAYRFLTSTTGNVS